MRRCSCFLSLFLILAVGCDNPTEFESSITGEVSLYDEVGNQLPSADQVQVSALSSSSVRRYQTSTDASGWFELELPEEEDLALLFSRDGFGDMFRYDIEEETEPLQVSLFQRSSTSVTAVQPVAESCGTVNCLRLTMEVENFFGGTTTRRLFRLYLSTDPELEPWDYQFTTLLVVPNDQPGLVQTGSDATFEVEGGHGLLESFATGATVHLLIYGATENLANSYMFPGEELGIFTDLSTTSATASFIIP